MLRRYRSRLRAGGRSALSCRSKALSVSPYLSVGQMASAGVAGEAFRVSVAPMVDVTTRHFRYLIRLMSKRTALYTLQS